jgi:hypothetical protein
MGDSVTLVFVLLRQGVRNVRPMGRVVGVHIVFNTNTEHMNKNNKMTKTNSPER